MTSKIRFGDFVREVSLKQNSLSYNLLTPPVTFDESGKEIPYQPKKLQLRGIDIYRLLGPYVGLRLMSQIKAVVPLVVYLILFQVLILRQNIVDHLVITGGLVAVILGLMVFMEGLKLGLMPFGEVIGNTLPKKIRTGSCFVDSFFIGYWCYLCRAGDRSTTGGGIHC
jgi:hypothetical protein